MEIDAYPLCWPAEYPRAKQRKDSRFRTTLAAARDYVFTEIKRMNGKLPIISSNIPVNKNGELRGDYHRYKVDDPGIAVYFTRNNQQVVLCCDAYGRTWENLHAIGRTIEALRQIDRDGVSDFLNRSFTGFKALAEKAGNAYYWQVLEMEPTTDIELIRKQYKELCGIHHPDKGGNHSMMAEINLAYAMIKKEVENGN